MSSFRIHRRRWVGFRVDADFRRDRRHRPQSTLHDGAVTATTPARTKPLPPGDGLGKRLAKGVAVYVDGRAELRPEPMKTRG